MEDFGRFEKVMWVENETSNKKGRLSLARRSQARGIVVGWGVDRWKRQHRKIMPLSPYVEEPLNSKVIKSFVPELTSRNCFSCFGIPLFYVYMLCTFYVRFTHIRIWLWYTSTRVRSILKVKHLFLWLNSQKSMLKRPSRCIKERDEKPNKGMRMSSHQKNEWVRHKGIEKRLLYRFIIDDSTLLCPILKWRKRERAFLSRWRNISC